MKKLLIAIGAAAMVSLGAQAAYGTLNTGTDFQGLEAGAFDPTFDDNGDKNGPYYWANRGAVTGDSVIVAEESPSENKYLKVDETEELTRLIHAPGSASASEAVDNTQDVYFSSKVQFTAADDEPAVSNGVDKIIVWAKAPAEDAEPGTTTNLMVTALNLLTQQNEPYDTQIAIDCEKWYTLKIVATQQAGASPIAFKVTLTDDEGQTYNAGTYNSMVKSGGGDATTISSVSFKGTGAVDDLDWGTEEPVAVEYFSFSASIKDQYDEQAGQLPSFSSATYQIDSGALVAFDGDTPVENLQVPVTTDTITLQVTVYDDAEVTNAGFVKGASAVPLDDGEGYVWTLAMDVSDFTKDTTTNVVINIVKTGGGGDEGWDAAESAADDATAVSVWPLIPEGLRNANAKLLAAWATANNIAFNNADTILVDAFMLNCANTAEAVTTEKAAFKLNITINSSNVPEVTSTTNNTASLPYNVTPVIKGKETLGDADWVAPLANDMHFYKGFMSLE